MTTMNQNNRWRGTFANQRGPSCLLSKASAINVAAEPVSRQ
jgi:hypothetical protein